MIKVDQINEIERASRYLLQQCTNAKNALLSLNSMQIGREFSSHDMVAIAQKNADRQERFLITAAQQLQEELAKLPDSAIATTGGEA